jgi:hypothetical protein
VWLDIDLQQLGTGRPAGRAGPRPLDELISRGLRGSSARGFVTVFTQPRIRLTAVVLVHAERPEIFDS